MTIEMIIVFAVILIAIVLFVTEVISVDITAISVMAVLVLTGIITVEEGLAGFSNNATVTIGAMFILSAGLYKTGFVNFAGTHVINLFKKNIFVGIALTLFIIALFSAFVNNTPVVAIFIPIMLGVAQEIKMSPSKLLIPLSYASIFGGMCTLLGTSTNILVSSLAVQNGQPAFGMFEFTPLGLILLAVGILYLLFVGIPLTPSRRGSGGLTENFGMGDYLTEVVVTGSSSCAGKSIEDCPLVKELDIDILKILRNEKDLPFSPFTLLKENDVMIVRTNIEKIKALQEQEGITLKPQLKFRDIDFESDDSVLTEAIIAPNSLLVGKTLKNISFRNRFKATALAIRHSGEIIHEKIGSRRLKAGDALLVETKKNFLDRLKDNKNFVVVSEVGLPVYRKKKMIISLLILAGVVISASVGLAPIALSSIIGAVLMLLTGCLNLEEAYQSVDLKIISMLAGSLSLGLALDKTGGAKFLSDHILTAVGPYGHIAILGAFYMLTLILTEAMSNNATAALITPIAIVTAASLGVSARPFLVAVAFAATLAFMSPIGYQTHLLVYGPGHYKFKDFVKVGLPLDILLWILATLLIPIFFPF